MSGVSIMMFIFAGVTLIMAFITYKGHTGWIRTMKFVKVDDPKEYAKELGINIAIVSIAPIVSGIVGLSDPNKSMKWFLISFLGCLVLICILGVKAYNRRQEQEESGKSDNEKN